MKAKVLLKSLDSRRSKRTWICNRTLKTWQHQSVAINNAAKNFTRDTRSGTAPRTHTMVPPLEDPPNSQPLNASGRYWSQRGDAYVRRSQTGPTRQPLVLQSALLFTPAPWPIDKHRHEQAHAYPSCLHVSIITMSPSLPCLHQLCLITAMRVFSLTFCLLPSLKRSPFSSFPSSWRQLQPAKRWRTVL